MSGYIVQSAKGGVIKYLAFSGVPPVGPSWVDSAGGGYVFTAQADAQQYADAVTLARQTSVDSYYTWPPADSQDGALAVYTLSAGWNNYLEADDATWTRDSSLAKLYSSMPAALTAAAIAAAGDPAGAYEVAAIPTYVVRDNAFGWEVAGAQQYKPYWAQSGYGDRLYAQSFAEQIANLLNLGVSAGIPQALLCPVPGSNGWYVYCYIADKTKWLAQALNQFYLQDTGATRFVYRTAQLYAALIPMGLTGHTYGVQPATGYAVRQTLNGVMTYLAVDPVNGAASWTTLDAATWTNQAQANAWLTAIDSGLTARAGGASPWPAQPMAFGHTVNIEYKDTLGNYTPRYLAADGRAWSQSPIVLPTDKSAGWAALFGTQDGSWQYTAAVAPAPGTSGWAVEQLYGSQLSYLVIPNVTTTDWTQVGAYYNFNPGLAAVFQDGTQDGEAELLAFASWWAANYAPWGTFTTITFGAHTYLAQITGNGYLYLAHASECTSPYSGMWKPGPPGWCTTMGSNIQEPLALGAFAFPSAQMAARARSIASNQQAANASILRANDDATMRSFALVQV